MKNIKKLRLFQNFQDNGLSAFLKNINRLSKKNPFLNFILNFDKKHFIVLKFLKDIERLEKGIEKYGVQNQALKFLSKLKIKTSAYTDLTNKNFQNQKGLLIYGINHNGIVEPIILFSLLRQKNIKLILYKTFFNIGKNIKKYSLPVMAKNYLIKKKFKLFKNFSITYKFHEYEKLNYEQIVKMNKNSILEAAKTLENEGIVIIFPGGGGNELNKWGFGISRILLSINKRKRDKIHILPVYFSGLGYKRMIFRIVKAYRNKKLDKIRVGVYFGKEKKVSQLFNELKGRLSEKTISNYLRKDAFSQYGLKEFPIKMYLYPQNYHLAFLRGFLFFAKFLAQITPFRQIKDIL